MTKDEIEAAAGRIIYENNFRWKVYEEINPRMLVAYDLRRARVKSGFTQFALADETGLTQAMVARLESGRSNSTIDTISLMADILGMQLRVVDA